MGAAEGDSSENQWLGKQAKLRSFYSARKTADLEFGELLFSFL